jgi:hypothetical protein
MKVFYEIDTTEYRAEELRKSLRGRKDASSVAVKLMLVTKGVQDLSDIERLYNKFSGNDE